MWPRKPSRRPSEHGSSIKLPWKQLFGCAHDQLIKLLGELGQQAQDQIVLFIGDQTTYSSLLDPIQAFTDTSFCSLIDVDLFLLTLFTIAAGDIGGDGIDRIHQVLTESGSFKGLPFLDDVPHEVTEAEALAVRRYGLQSQSFAFHTI